MKLTKQQIIGSLTAVALAVALGFASTQQQPKSIVVQQELSTMTPTAIVYLYSGATSGEKLTN